MATIDHGTFERALGCKVSDRMFASISASGPALYLALQEIVKEVQAAPDSDLALRVRAIASTAFTQATN